MSTLSRASTAVAREDPEEQEADQKEVSLARRRRT
jgi:hypothetical protein